MERINRFKQTFLILLTSSLLGGCSDIIPEFTSFGGIFAPHITEQSPSKVSGYEMPFTISGKCHIDSEGIELSFNWDGNWVDAASIQLPGSDLDCSDEKFSINLDSFSALENMGIGYFINPEGVVVYARSYSSSFGMSDPTKAILSTPKYQQLTTHTFEDDGSEPFNFVVSGSQMFFYAIGPHRGRELWVTNGTIDRTERVMDINPMGDSIDCQTCNPMIAYNGGVIFAANDGTNGRELWFSNGTEAGTYLIKDIYSGPSDSYPENFEAHNGYIFFTATDSTNGTEIWKTDGTTGGTTLVTNFASANPNISNLKGMFLGLFFRANDGSNGLELWKTDGNLGNQTLIDIYAGSPSSSPSYLTEYNGSLYFAASGSASDIELWKYDGSVATLVYDINPAGSSNPLNLTVVNGLLFFSANDGGTAYGTEVMYYDGSSTPGTIDIFPGTGASFPSSFFTLGNDLFVIAKSNASYGYEIHKIDTASKTASQLKDISSGTASTSVNHMVEFNNKIYFNCYTNGENELWVTDGTPANTNEVVNLNGSSSSDPQFITNFSGNLFFSAQHPNRGREPWVSNGSIGNASLLKNINTYSQGLKPEFKGIFLGKILFTANDGNRELWISDGTNSGTFQLKDINTNGSSNPDHFFELNGEVYFTAQDSNYDTELYKTNGTVSGTKRVADINPGTSSSSPSNFTALNNELYFIATTDSTGYQIWKTDGTTTTQVTNLCSGAGSANLSDLVTYSGSIYFTADGCDGNGVELYETNGSTVNLATNITGDSTSSYPSNKIVFNGKLYFSAQTASTGNELWSYNAGDSFATLVKNITTTSSSSSPQNMHIYNGALYFQAYTATEGDELWKTDGTEAGTTLVSDINPSSNSSYPQKFYEFNGELYFVATTSSEGTELWKTNGTSTSLVKDIWPGSSYSMPREFTTANNTLYFVADNGNGIGLWQSDGTSAGTFLIHNFGFYTSSANSTSIIGFNNNLLLSTNRSSQHGQQIIKFIP